MRDTYQSLRPFLKDYLHTLGINPARRFRCLNPEHTDTHPSMGFDARRNKVHCFACGADYDLFDVIRIEEQLPTANDAFIRARALYGRPETNDKPDAENDYISACASLCAETTYFSERGLSEETIVRFSLGYDPKKNCVVLPCGSAGIVRRSINGKRYLNEKGRPSPLFQPELLAGDEPVFIVEGTFDALSAEELGFRACALNGAGNYAKAAEQLRARKKSGIIMVLPDHDAAGEAWAVALCAEFPWLYRCEPLEGVKDLNELLCMDREATYGYLARCVEAAEPAEPFYESRSAVAQLAALQDYIATQARKPALRTGFPALDTALDGGLYDGLYVLGAVSSLGKTAFCMQLADQLAMQGSDVLVFSLEMSAYELIARSISRETFQRDETRGKELSKTVRGVLDGRRYAGYTEMERAHLEEATEAYRVYAGHLYFPECDHETGIEAIREEVERHIAESGRKPVVLVDYLQIVAPVDVHFTDKQNVDRIVTALKKLSRTQELTILAISSFNRENYNLEANMSAFKESGGIDYSADVLLGLQARGAGTRNFNLDAEKRKDPRELELKILKNRTGALGDPVALRYYAAYSCFEECR